MPSSSQFSRRVAPSLALVLALAASSLAQVTKAGTATVSTMPVPSILSGATLVGRVPSTALMKLSISLAPSNRASFQAYANSVSDPKSQNYHRFLSPVQIGERFGPSANTVNAVVSYLQGKGLTVTLAADNRMSILFQGLAGKVESAFNTKLNLYKVASRENSQPTQFYSYSTVLTLPSAFAGTVVCVDGLTNAFRPVKRSTLSPSQTAVLYNLVGVGGGAGGAHRGQGINLGITNFDGYRLSNLPLFYSTYGLPTPSGGVGANITKVSVNGGDGETGPAQGEGDLDIQLALAMAPLANLYIYDPGATSTGSLAVYEAGYLPTLTKEANDNLVDVVSESYGFPTIGYDTAGIINGAHDQHVAMTAQGITYLLATGDYGTDLGGLDYPDFDPDILQVGGTYATVDAQGNRQSEGGWNGSGGGYSAANFAFNVLPSYQKGKGVPTNINRRLYPDVALHAAGANDGSALEYAAYNFVLNGALSAVSGTSASSPTFAGQLAVILQQLAENDLADPASNGRPRLGRINDLIYEANGDPSIFLDILTGDIGPLLSGQEAVGAPGWDFVTGWGAPDDAGLYQGILTYSSTPVAVTPTTPSLYITATSPTITLGTNVSGDSNSLGTIDGTSYSVTSVKQSGVGQVAAFKIAYTLPSTSVRSASLSITMNSPSLTTGFVYFLNPTTNAYEAITAIAGSGAMKTTTVQIDLSKYLSGTSVQALIRFEKPTRLGSAPFVASVDRAVVTARVPRSSASIRH